MFQGLQTLNGRRFCPDQRSQVPEWDSCKSLYNHKHEYECLPTYILLLKTHLGSSSRSPNQLPLCFNSMALLKYFNGLLITNWKTKKSFLWPNILGKPSLNKIKPVYLLHSQHIFRLHSWENVMELFFSWKAIHKISPLWNIPYGTPCGPQVYLFILDHSRNTAVALNRN